MKKILLALALFASVISAKSQTDTDKIDNFEKKNEVKLNAVMLLVGAFEATYERNLNEESSIGLSILIPYDDENFDSDFNYYLSPYYRVFFGKKYASGFFVEGFGMLNSYKQRTFDFSDIPFDGFINETSENKVNFALGIGLGGKWITKNGILFEINAGFGRNLLNSDINNDYEFVGKLGLNVGYRF